MVCPMRVVVAFVSLAILLGCSIFFLTGSEQPEFLRSEKHRERSWVRVVCGDAVCFRASRQLFSTRCDISHALFSCAHRPHSPCPTQWRFFVTFFTGEFLYAWWYSGKESGVGMAFPCEGEVPKCVGEDATAAVEPKDAIGDTTQSNTTLDGRVNAVE
jgi:hypothetical protein